MTFPRLRIHTSLTAAVIGAMALIAGSCNSTPEAPLVCPEVALVSDAVTITRFSPGRGQDLTDVDYTAELTDFDLQCAYSGSRDPDQRVVVVALAPVITVIRGPANVDRTATMDYIVSVTDQQRNILSAQRFPVSVRFAGNRNRTTVTDNDPPVTVAIPLAPGASADSYQIFVAFHLSPEELDYNRRTQGPRL
jgi:hypothetical protein